MRYAVLITCLATVLLIVAACGDEESTPTSAKNSSGSSAQTQQAATTGTPFIQEKESDKRGLPMYAEGAANVILTDVYIGQPDDFSSALERSDLVVGGVIDELYPARWSTVDNAAPGTITREVVKDLAIHIRTPVQLSVKRVFKGKSVGDTLKFSFVGGRVGDTAHVYEWSDVFEEGTRVIVFLAKGGPGSAAHNVEPQGLYPRMHLVVRGDVAQGPIKDIPMKELLGQLQ